MNSDAVPIDMKPLFYPKTIAVIGVSKNKVSGMKFVFANHVSGYTANGGKVFPINPKYHELYGYKVYPSLFNKSVPDIDLAIIAVPAPAVPGVILDCSKKGVKFAVIFTSGFEESKNYELQKQLEHALEKAKKTTRFIGPNCLGINNPYSKVSYYPGLNVSPGNVSYVSMSGGHTGRLSHWMSSQGLGLNNVVSIGNSSDLTATDFVNYFREDQKTDVIALYIESIPNGRRFFNALCSTTRKKPIVLWKGGQTDAGQKATSSHTGGLAGSVELWSAMSKQSGVIYADHFELFSDLITALSVKTKLPKDENVCILVCGGGIGVEYTDLCIKHGLRVPELSEQTQSKLGEVFSKVNTSFKNPVDLGEYGYIPDYFDKALRIVVTDPKISSIIYVREAERFILFEKTLGVPNMEALTLKMMKDISKDIEKPLFCTMSPNGQETKYYEARYNFKLKMLEQKLPVIDWIPNACEVIKRLVQYNRYIQKPDH